MSRPTCCNGNCGQSDDCPFRQPRSMTSIERLTILAMVAVWGVVMVALLMGGAP